MPSQSGNLRRPKTCDFSPFLRVRVSSDWLWRGGIVKRFEPEYPEEAKQKRLQGQVSVRILIDQNSDVVQACGTGPAVLRQAAEDAALQWKFRVPRLNGEPLPYSEADLTFNFVLSKTKFDQRH